MDKINKKNKKQPPRSTILKKNTSKNSKSALSDDIKAKILEVIRQRKITICDKSSLSLVLSELNLRKNRYASHVRNLMNKNICDTNTPSTSSQLPSTYIQLPSTSSQLPSTSSQLPSQQQKI